MARIEQVNVDGTNYDVGKLASTTAPGVVQVGSGLGVNSSGVLSANVTSVNGSTGAVTINVPTVNNATLTIQKNGSNVQTFTANASSNVTANITVPTKTSDLTNDGAGGTGAYTEDFIITVSSYDFTNGTFTADKTFAQVQTAYESNKRLILKATIDGMVYLIPCVDVYVASDEYSIDFIYSIANTIVGNSAGLSNTCMQFGFARYGTSSANFTYENWCSNGADGISITNSLATRPSSVKIAPSAQCVYDALANKANSSDIPTVNNATLTIQKNGTTVKTFTANASSNVTANITVPTQTSDLTNNSGFLTSSTGVTSVNGAHGAVAGIQTTSNLVTSVSSSSTNSQYPSAKLFYDTVGNVESVLQTLNSGTGV